MHKLYSGFLAAALTVVLTICTSGCSKKAAPAPAAKAVAAVPAQPAAPADALKKQPAAAPTVSITAEPTIVMKGQSAVLNWRSTDADTVEIDNGIGKAAAAGRITITPTGPVTYTAKATGPGGTAAASVRITVQSPPAAAAPPALSDQDFFSRRIQDVFFDFDQFDIRTDQRKELDNAALALKERTNLKILIEGHCDERGSEKYNLVLGDKRANEVKAYLVQQGVTGDRIDTISYGYEKPFDLGHNEDAWAKNRRGHFVLKND